MAMVSASSVLQAPRRGDEVPVRLLPMHPPKSWTREVFSMADPGNHGRIPSLVLRNCNLLVTQDQGDLRAA